MYLLMKTGSKPGHYNPLPLGITPSLVFQYIGIPIQYIYNCTSKISKFCTSVPRSIIHFERSRPSPLASMNFSCWFSALGLSQSLGALWLFPSLCSLIGQSRHKWCPPYFQHFAGCFIFSCSISFESSCLVHFLMDHLDECPIIDPLSFPLPLRISPIRIFTSFCKPIESWKI